MTTVEFFDQLDARIAKYDLLCHPFYKAWAAGELTREDLRDYARDYYHHVDAFPAYLEDLCARLGEGELRSAVMANMADENGMEGFSGQPSVRTPIYGWTSWKAWEPIATWLAISPWQK